MHAAELRRTDREAGRKEKRKKKKESRIQTHVAESAGRRAACNDAVSEVLLV